MKTTFAVVATFAVYGSFVLAAERSEFAVSQQMILSDSTKTESRSVIKFDLDSVIRGKDIDYAAVDLQFEPTEGGSSDYIVLIHPIKREWTDAASWGANNLGRPGTDYMESIAIPIVVSASNNYRARAVLTPIVKLWAEGTVENLGLILIGSKKGSNRAKLASKSEQGVVDPKLEVYTAQQ